MIDLSTVKITLIDHPGAPYDIYSAGANNALGPEQLLYFCGWPDRSLRALKMLKHPTMHSNLAVKRLRSFV